MTKENKPDFYQDQNKFTSSLLLQTHNKSTIIQPYLPPYEQKCDYNTIQRHTVKSTLSLKGIYIVQKLFPI